MSMGASPIQLLCKKLSKRYNNTSMISKYNHKELNWIDLESPTKEEIEHIIEEYTVPLNIKELLYSKEKDDKFEIVYDFIYASIENKITFIVCDKFIISIHQDPMPAFTTSSKELEIDMVSIEKINSNRILFAHLLKNLFKNREVELSYTYKQIEKFRKQILEKNKQLKNKQTLIIILIIIALIFLWL